ncbi:hypothetical protein AXF42_Ash005402 [Apostasia shenzhenica]|uniref:Mediator of RNA polymerase II transcription subunit 18 n=1 Tax=Apostasia shenzhenica TaxID=1088818 RepID=A0A2I0B6S4_9ASPA|nr:hypothetical protein AXF42_Ash005402 [Apostasia shenzhenica]
MPIKFRKLYSEHSFTNLPMEASLSSFSPSARPPSLIKPSPFLRRANLPCPTNPKRLPAARGGSSAEPDYPGGRLVDENMIVLRRLIHQMKAAETNYEPPENWAEWERRYYLRYGSDVCELVGWLQALLLGLRPSVAIAVASVLLLSLPASFVIVLLCFVDFCKTLI